MMFHCPVDRFHALANTRRLFGSGCTASGWQRSNLAPPAAPRVRYRWVTVDEFAEACALKQETFYQSETSPREVLKGTRRAFTSQTRLRSKAVDESVKRIRFFLSLPPSNTASFHLRFLPLHFCFFVFLFHAFILYVDVLRRGCKGAITDSFLFLWDVAQKLPARCKLLMHTRL